MAGSSIGISYPTFVLGYGLGPLGAPSLREKTSRVMRAKTASLTCSILGVIFLTDSDAFEAGVVVGEKCMQLEWGPRIGCW